MRTNLNQIVPRVLSAAAPLAASELVRLVPSLELSAAAAVLGIVAMPSTVPCLGHVLDNAKSAWPTLATLLRDTSAPVDDAARGLDMLRGHSALLGASCPAFYQPGDAQRLPLRGSVDSFPVYGMLSRRLNGTPNVTGSGSSFTVLGSLAEAMALIIAAQIRLAEVHVVSPVAGESDLTMADLCRERVRAAARDIRLLPLDCTHLLAPLPTAASDGTARDAPLDPDEVFERYHHVLQKAFDDPIRGPASRKYLDGFARLVATTVEQRPPYRRSRTEGARTVHRARPAALFDLMQADDPDEPAIPTWTPAGADEDEAEAVKAGCAQNEVPSAVVFVEAAPPAADDVAPSCSSLALQRRRCLSAMAAGAQHLRMRWNRLQPTDLAYFLSELAGLSRADASDSSLSIPPAELAAFVAVCFWLSASPQRAVQLRIVDSLTDFPDETLSGSLYYAQKDRCWSLPIATPKLKQAGLVAQETGQARPLAKRLILPDASDVGTLLAPLAARGNATCPFQRPASEYKKAINQWLRLIDAEPPHRLTLGRIETCVFWAIFDTSHDLVTAVLATARSHSEAANQLHYFTPTTEFIRTAYWKACRKLLESVNAESSHSTTTVDRSDLDQPVHAGSPLCPTDGAARALVVALTEQVESARAVTSTPAQVVDFHNRFGFYLLRMWSDCVANRAICDPVGALDQFDLQLRRAVIADKTNDASYTVRVVVLPELLCQQLALWIQHLHALLPHLMSLNTETHDRLKALLRCTKCANPLPAIFLLKPNGNAATLRPKEMKSRLEAAGYFLPVNSNRHFIRTKLVEKGASAEQVEWVLGHWKFGQEPFHTFGTLGLDHLERQISPLLQEILLETGWKALPGLTHASA